MQDLSKLPDAELEAQRDGLNAKRDLIVAELRVITTEQGNRSAIAKAAEFLAGLTPAQREAIKNATTLAPRSIDSASAIGRPGAA